MTDPNSVKLQQLIDRAERGEDRERSLSRAMRLLEKMEDEYNSWIDALREDDVGGLDCSISEATQRAEEIIQQLDAGISPGEIIDDYMVLREYFSRPAINIAEGETLKEMTLSELISL